MKSKEQSKIEEAICSIKDNYKIGQKILEDCGARSSKAKIARKAKENGISHDKCHKLRAMAVEGTGYTQEELDRWYDVFRAAGFALTITHFIKLISVPEKEDRDDLTTKAIENRWSSHRLQSEILAHLGRRRFGGRKPTVAIDEGFKAELARTLWSWEHWLAIHLKANKSIEPKLLEDLQTLQSKIERLRDSLVPQTKKPGAEQCR